MGPCKPMMYRTCIGYTFARTLGGEDFGESTPGGVYCIPTYGLVR